MNDEEYGEWIETGAVLNDDNTYRAEVSLTALNYLNRYTFQAMAVDLLSSVESVEKTVKTTPVFDWGENDFNFNVPVTILGKTLLDLLYPIGSIYMSVEPTDPSELFGGKWESWCNGRVPVGVYELDTDFNAAEKHGGEKYHTLTIDEMPSHAHGGVYWNQNTGYGHINDGSTDGANKANITNIPTQGGNQPHNNMPPYLTCYMWKRIA